MNPLLLCLGFLLSYGLASAATPAVSREQIQFTTPGSLVRTGEPAKFEPGPDIRLSGELALPTGTGPFPLVMLAHGCYGITAVENGWANTLNDWGYATFVMDSFTGRDLDEVCTNPRTLHGLQRIPDAYGALRALSKHRGIDSRRVALMGFSHGGILTVGAATAWAKKQFASAGQPAFRAFFPFYPLCNVDYAERATISAPVRVHIGANDDWTPAETCVRMVKGWKASGQNADIALYANAGHSFDDVGASPTFYADAVNPSACDLRMPSILGPLLKPADVTACLKHGATLGGNREATAKAEKQLRQQLTELLNSKAP